MTFKKEKLHPQGCKSRVIEIREFQLLYLESAEGDRVALGVHLEGEVGPGQPSCVLAAMSRKQLHGLRDYLTSCLDQVDKDQSLT